ncbi:MAG: hypothetical protein GYB68_17045 [Chloroflexi bacterium]|nr:hypothetical protein [Chloroflexota bacterium]
MFGKGARKIDIQVSVSESKFKPGDTVSASVSLYANEDVNAKDTTVELIWYTEGKGDRDEGIIESMVIHSGDWSSGQSLSETVGFTLPEGPWSYRGHFITILWAIRVTVATRNIFSNIFDLKTFVMSPYDDVALPNPNESTATYSEESSAF